LVSESSFLLREEGIETCEVAFLSSCVLLSFVFGACGFFVENRASKMRLALGLCLVVVGLYTPVAFASQLCSDQTGVESLEVVAGSKHTCLWRRLPGQIWCFGDGEYGKLGTGSEEDLNPALNSQRIEPIDLGTEDAEIADVTAGLDHTCVLLTNGTAKCFGNNRQGQSRFTRGGDSVGNDKMGENLEALDFLEEEAVVTQLVASQGFSCALLSNNEIRCFGSNDDGQLGAGLTDNRVELDEILLQPAVDLGVPQLKIKQLGCGGTTCSAIFEHGRIKMWGWGSRGTIPRGNKLTERRVGTMGNEMGRQLPFLDFGNEHLELVQACSGAFHSCFLLSDRHLEPTTNTSKVFCYGINTVADDPGANSGILGVPNGIGEDIGGKNRHIGERSDEYALIRFPEGLIPEKLSCGVDFRCALGTMESSGESRAYCWGFNGDTGKFGTGNGANIGASADEMGLNMVPVAIPNGHRIRDITAGNGFICVLLSEKNSESRKVLCYGSNNDGPATGTELGQGNVPSNSGNNAQCVDLSMFVNLLE